MSVLKKLYTCAPEKTLEEEENIARWQALSVEEKMLEQHNEAWSVIDFTSWFEPGENGLNERYWSCSYFEIKEKKLHERHHSFALGKDSTSENILQLANSATKLLACT